MLAQFEDVVSIPLERPSSIRDSATSAKESRGRFDVPLLRRHPLSQLAGRVFTMVEEDRLQVLLD